MSQEVENAGLWEPKFRALTLVRTGTPWWPGEGGREGWGDWVRVPDPMGTVVIPGSPLPAHQGEAPGHLCPCGSPLEAGTPTAHQAVKTGSRHLFSCRTSSLTWPVTWPCMGMGSLNPGMAQTPAGLQLSGGTPCKPLSSSEPQWPQLTMRSGPRLCERFSDLVGWNGRHKHRESELTG